MTRQNAIDHVSAYFDSGKFRADLSRRIALRTESQLEDAAATLRKYLSGEIASTLDAMGFTSEIVENPIAGMPPMLLAERIEDPQLPGVLLYGHGDVINGDASNWTDGRSPW